MFIYVKFFLIIIFSFGVNAQELNRDKYKETDKLIINPDRGFYLQIGSKYRPVSQYGITSTSTQNYDDEEQSHHDYRYNATVYRVYFSLSLFKETKIDDEALTRLENLLIKANKEKITLIPRFYYTWGYDKGKRVFSPNSEIIIKHVKQIAPILNKYSSAISFLEAGFIGAWGEWHSDQYGNQKKFHPFRKTLVQTLLTELNENIFIALRYPSDYHKINKLKGINRVGLHHDCPNYHYDFYPKSNAQKITTTVPQGGEVCERKPKGQFGKSSNFEKYYGCKIMKKYFDKFNFDVLNGSDWSKSNSRFEKQGCWKEIRDRLGYRFVITGSKLSNGILYFEVKNVGFGKSFKKRLVSLKIGNKIIKTQIDVSNWTSGGTYIEKIEVGTTSDKKGELIVEGDIKFANTTRNFVFFD